MTALRKNGGGVRGIVAGEVFRRFTAKTIAQLSTRAGCECIAHALQALTELDPDSTVMSNRRHQCMRHHVSQGHAGRSGEGPSVVLQVVAPDWILSFRIKCVGLKVIFWPHPVTENRAVLNILEGQ